MRVWVALLASALGSCSRAAPTNGPEPSLEFRDEGRVVATLRLSELRAKVPEQTFTAFDPYYAKTKTFRALPFDAVARLGFAALPNLDQRELLLRARDGYTVPLRPPLSTEAGSYIAFADVDAPAWEPIGPQRANPGPFYFVWRGASQQNLETHPRPWQLAVIEVARFEVVFPHTVPSGEPSGSPALEGFALFRDRCVRCHAINREGGRVGPELNVPQNILEYRPEPQVRAYVKNPLSFRYGNMPAHPDLSDRDLDHLIAYLAAMKSRKFDPETRP